MTEPERAALDHIRQVVDSVIGAPNFLIPFPQILCVRSRYPPARYERIHSGYASARRYPANA